MKRVTAALPRLFHPHFTPVRRTVVTYFGSVGAPRDRAVYLMPAGTVSAIRAPLAKIPEPVGPSIRDSRALGIHRSMWAQVVQG